MFLRNAYCNFSTCLVFSDLSGFCVNMLVVLRSRRVTFDVRCWNSETSDCRLGVGAIALCTDVKNLFNSVEPSAQMSMA